MADRQKKDIVSIWTAVIARLRTQLSLNSDTCFFWLGGGSDPQPPPVATDLFLTVAPDGGTFDEGLQDGGGAAQNTIKTGIAVTIYTQIFLENDSRDDQFLTHSTKGVGAMFTRVCNALIDHDPTFSGVYAMREQIRPSGFSAPRRSSIDRYGKMTIMFELTWDLG